MKKAIIITSINESNDNLRKFSESDYDLIMVGDKKSPDKYDMDCIYLDTDTQIDSYSKISELLPYNHYSRKNIGYIHAITNGYKQIAESDDDNYPLSNWGIIPNDYLSIVNNDVVNIYSLFTDEKVWPRGYPINRINSQCDIKTTQEKLNPVIWQYMVDGDPDVDAIYRMTYGNKDFSFNEGSYVLKEGCITPFNTQNTIWTDPKYFVYTYLPSTVSFRFTDILRSFVAQYGIWAMGGNLGYSSATVIQDRNEHDLMVDFASEVEMYNNYDIIMETLNVLELKGDRNDIIIMYKSLLDINIVTKKEIEILNEWIKYF